MAAFSFPSNPTVGQTYTGPNNIVYTWDGVKWKANTQFTVVTTPPQFDNDTSIATTEFVQRALGNYRGVSYSSVTSGITLQASDAGIMLFLAASAGQTVTLPPGASLPNGASFTVIRAVSGTTATVQSSGAQMIDSGNGQATSVTLRGGDTATFVWSSGAGLWFMEGTAVMRIVGMNSSLTGNGYQKLPSGLILQWGTVNVSSSGTSFSFPISFPTALLNLSGTPHGSTTGIASNPAFASGSTSGSTVYPWGGTNYTCWWQAIGY